MNFVRNDYPEKTIKYRNGSTKTIPAHYEIRYYACDEKEIAWYESKDNTLYLKTSYIAHDFKKTYSERIIGSKYENEYKELLVQYQKVSEYMSA